MTDFHPLVKRLLDGEVTLAELPPDLRAEGQEALRLLDAVNREPVTLSTAVESNVMVAVRRRAAAPSLWRRLTAPREVRLRVRPWTLAPALAAAAALVLLLGRPGPAPTAVAPPTVTVRFVLFAPEARQVGLAGTFNQWDAAQTPLVRAGAPGVWTATLTLPSGQHQYAFVIDGARWVLDPAAPAVDDGFGGGRRNSVLTL
jgi:Glycogen recognition site of AMP-activated protein kinase